MSPTTTDHAYYGLLSWGKPGLRLKPAGLEVTEFKWCLPQQQTMHIMVYFHEVNQDFDVNLQVWK
jgi:hypothetical protein